MAQAVGRHDALLRDRRARSRGPHRQDDGRRHLRRVRDSQPTVSSLVIEIQLALLDPAATSGLGLRVRCGLHSGPRARRATTITSAAPSIARRAS